jgi:hypothetical protein
MTRGQIGRPLYHEGEWALCTTPGTVIDLEMGARIKVAQFIIALAFGRRMRRWYVTLAGRAPDVARRLFAPASWETAIYDAAGSERSSPAARRTAFTMASISNGFPRIS